MVNVYVEIKHNTFFVGQAGRIPEKIPAFILKTEDTCFFGLEACRAMEIFPIYIYSLYDLIANKDTMRQKMLFAELKKFLYKRFDAQFSLTFKVPFFYCASSEACIKEIFNGVRLERNEEAVTNFYVMAKGVLSLGIKNNADKTIVADRYSYLAFRDALVNYLVKSVRSSLLGFDNNAVRYLKAVLRKKLDSIIPALTAETAIKITINVPIGLKVHKVEMSLDAAKAMATDFIQHLQVINKTNEEKLKQVLYLEKNEGYKVCLISLCSYDTLTMLNELIGSELLTADLRAETGIVIKLMITEKKQVVFCYEHGQREIFSYNTKEQLKDVLASYVRVRDNNTGIKEIKILYDNLDMDGITLLDTPLSGLQVAGRSETAEEALRQSDLALVVIDPGNLSDRKYTAKLRQYKRYIDQFTSNVCVVLAKTGQQEDRVKLYEALEEVLPQTNVINGGELLPGSYSEIYLLAQYIKDKQQISSL